MWIYHFYLPISWWIFALFSPFLLLSIMMLRTFMNNFWVDVFFHFSGVFIWEWSYWVIKVTLCLTVGGTARLFSEVAASFTSPKATYNFSTSLPILVIWFFYFSHLVLSDFLKWYLIVVLIHISVISNNVKHLFMSLLTIYIYSLETCLFSSFLHFSIRLSNCYCYWVVSILHLF